MDRVLTSIRSKWTSLLAGIVLLAATTLPVFAQAPPKCACKHLDVINREIADAEWLRDKFEARAEYFRGRARSIVELRGSYSKVVASRHVEDYIDWVEGLKSEFASERGYKSIQIVGRDAKNLGRPDSKQLANMQKGVACREIYDSIVVHESSHDDDLKEVSEDSLTAEYIAKSEVTAYNRQIAELQKLKATVEKRCPRKVDQFFGPVKVYGLICDASKAFVIDMTGPVSQSRVYLFPSGVGGGHYIKIVRQFRDEDADAGIYDYTAEQDAIRVTMQFSVVGPGNGIGGHEVNGVRFEFLTSKDSDSDCPSYDGSTDEESTRNAADQSLRTIGFDRFLTVVAKAIVRVDEERASLRRIRPFPAELLPYLRELDIREAALRKMEQWAHELAGSAGAQRPTS